MCLCVLFCVQSNNKSFSLSLILSTKRKVKKERAYEACRVTRHTNVCVRSKTNMHFTQIKEEKVSFFSRRGYECTKVHDYEDFFSNQGCKRTKFNYRVIIRIKGGYLFKLNRENKSSYRSDRYLKEVKYIRRRRLKIKKIMAENKTCA